MISPTLAEELKILDSVASTSSPNEKKSILASVRDNVTLREIFFYTYHPLYSFYLKKVPPYRKNEGLSPPNCWVQFKTTLDHLRNRSLTGTDAENEVVRILMGCHPDDAEIFERVLARDLRIGVGIQTLISPEVYGEDFVPLFEVMKAKKLESVKDIVFPCIVEPKIDGVRCFAIKNDGKVTLWSRRGHVFDNYPQIVKELEAITEVDYVVFDGELITKGSFSSTMSQVRRKYAISTEQTVFNIFDMLPNVSNSMPLWARRAWRDDVLGPHVGNTLELIDSFDCGKIEDVTQLYEVCLENGFEGVMIKDPNAPYYFKRHKAWLKWKPTDTLDLMVVGFQEGEGKYVGKLGALMVDLPVQIDSNGTVKHNIVYVGGGFSDTERRTFWAKQEEIVSTLVEVRYDRVTTNEKGGFSLRFPRFIRRRPDKKSTDIVEPSGKIHHGI